MNMKLFHSVAKFALQFINSLEKNDTTICSPLSAEIVLAMLALGCKNRSHDELMNALDMTNDDVLRSSFGVLTSSLKFVPRVSVNVANRIYVKNNKNVKAEIKKDMDVVFDSSVEQLNFEEEEASADVINKWVAQQTNNLIKYIVSPQIFDENTSMVLINAIYFKGVWANPFMIENTEDKVFFVNKTTIQVPQMYQGDAYLHYGISLNLKAKLLKMPYEGFQSSMVIVLPDEIEGLNSMLRQLAAGHDLLEDIITLKKMKVDVTIPKFKAETTVDMKNLLPKLGIKSIFDKDSSDIDILTSNERLFVSEAVQKAVIEVNEVGTEAAACSGVFTEDICAASPSRNPQFVADHPFLYLILAKGITLFIGTYCGPQ